MKKTITIMVAEHHNQSQNTDIKKHIYMYPENELLPQSQVDWAEDLFKVEPLNAQIVTASIYILEAIMTKFQSGGYEVVIKDINGIHSDITNNIWSLFSKPMRNIIKII